MRHPNPLTLLLTLAVALLAAPACAAPNAQTGDQTAAQKASAERTQIEALLRGYHGLPEKARFDAAAEDPAKILRVIAADTLAGPMRTAALEALKWWPDDRTFALYEQALGAQNTAGVRHKALRYLVVFGDRAVPLLADTAANDPSVQIRRTAITALFELPGQRAGKALADAAEKESDPALKAETDGLIQKRSSIR